MDASRTPNSRALRNGRVSIPGQIYLVTIVTSGRSAHFREFHAGCLASSTLNAAVSWPDAELIAWVLMPDHMHLLLQLGQREALSTVIQRVKGLLTIRLRPLIGVQSLWQASFHDHALRKSENIRAAARYLIANPLRAGLVDDIRNYPFWGADWLEPGANPLDP